MYKKAIRVECKKWSKDGIDWKSVNSEEESGIKLMWNYWEDEHSKWFSITGNADEWEMEIVKDREEIRKGIGNEVIGVIDGETWVKIRRKEEEKQNEENIKEIL